MSPSIPELPDDCDTLKAALLYADAGWYVLPVAPETKHAGSVLGKGWPQQSSRDPKQIAAWFAGTDYALALHVGRSGAVAFDVDSPALLPAALRDGIDERQPPFQSTRDNEPERGHYLFTAAAGTVGNSIGDLGKGWGEVRGLNGIIVVAPTVHEKAAGGGRYQWMRAGGCPTLPPALGAALRPPGATTGTVDNASLREFLDSLPAGEPCGAVEAIPIIMPASGRHDFTNDANMRLTRLGEQGHRGVKEQLARMRDLFVEAVATDRRGGAPEANAEYLSNLAGAVAEVCARPTADADKGCCGIELPDVGFEWSPSAGDGKEDGGEGGVGGLDPVEAMRAELLTSAQIARQPNPVPVVRGLLFLDTLAWLIGKSGSFKSFVALDVAQHVALGRSWASRRVRQGRVLYLVAEGSGGMTLRIRAWEKINGTASEDVYFLPRPVQANSGEWNVLLKLAHTLAPELVVIDTQARVSVGIKENDNTEMGMFIAQIDRLRRATGACVLLVHHIGRNGDDARGASAIDGAQDTELKVERVGGAKALTARLVTDKQKDAADTAAVDFEMVSVDLGEDPVTGDPLNSLIVNTNTFANPFVRPWDDDLPGKLGRILDVMHEQFSEAGATGAQVLAILREKGWERDYPRTTFYRAWNELQRTDRIEKITGSQRWLIREIDHAPI